MHTCIHLERHTPHVCIHPHILRDTPDVMHTCTYRKIPILHVCIHTHIPYIHTCTRMKFLMIHPCMHQVRGWAVVVNYKKVDMFQKPENGNNVIGSERVETNTGVHVLDVVMSVPKEKSDDKSETEAKPFTAVLPTVDMISSLCMQLPKEIRSRESLAKVNIFLWIFVIYFRFFGMVLLHFLMLKGKICNPMSVYVVLFCGDIDHGCEM